MDVLLVTIAVVKPAQAYVASVCAIAGSVLGSSILFAIAHKGGEVLLAKYISHGQGKKLHQWFERYGLITVFIPAISPLPMPMKIPVFCAGALEVRWPNFVAVVLSARVIRYLALATLGVQFGTGTFTYLKSHAIVVSVLIVGLAVLSIALLRLLDAGEDSPPADVEATM